MFRYLMCINITALMLLVSSCKREPAVTKDETDVEKVNLPYTVRDKAKWRMNEDPQNIILVMNALKAIESRDALRFGSYFTDSLIARGDGYIFKGTRAEMNKTNKLGLSRLKDVDIKVHDWQSVINESGTLAWVEVSYTQYKEDLKGKRDSIFLFNEVKIKEGKIEEWNEYLRNFPGR